MQYVSCVRVSVCAFVRLCVRDSHMTNVSFLSFELKSIYEFNVSFSLDVCKRVYVTLLFVCKLRLVLKLFLSFL